MQNYKFPNLGTHKASILYFLLLGNRIQNKKIGKYLDTNGSAARICELRSDGWDISDVPISMITKEKKIVTVKDYFIEPDKLYALLNEEVIQSFMKKMSVKVQQA